MNKKYIKIAVVVVLVSALAYACTATKSQKYAEVVLSCPDKRYQVFWGEQ
jgi:hypothetical protein